MVKLKTSQNDAHQLEGRLSEDPLSGLELTVINTPIKEKHIPVLREAHKFLARRYASDKVIPYEDALQQLSRPENKAYKWMVATENGQVRAVLVFDIWDVPKSPSTRGLVPDGKNIYTGVYYSKAAGKKYEPALQAMIQKAMEITQEDSKKFYGGKRNVGIIAVDDGHTSILRNLAKQYGGGKLSYIGVPTMKKIPDDKYNELAFKKQTREDFLAFPFDREWTKSIATRVAASFLDEGWNQKAPGEKGYKPSTNGDYWNPFVERIYAKNPGGRLVFGSTKK
ncbi:hypothetical protein HYY71_02555 [Candidatus Woesearchaeota archaeon]|nr:hypothetical protein [Candidatus Woesearchaeota archaeon]